MKLDDYRKKLNKQLLNLLTEEKKKDEEREKIFSQATNDNEKKRLNKIFSIERAQSSQKIAKFNEDMDVLLDKFESKLRKKE